MLNYYLYMLGLMEWVKNDWKNNRFIFLMETTNMLANILAMSYMSILFPNINWWLLYSFYIVGSTSGIIFALKRKTMPLLILYTTFIFFNIVGVIRLIYSAFFM